MTQPYPPEWDEIELPEPWEAEWHEMEREEMKETNPTRPETLLPIDAELIILDV